MNAKPKTTKITILVDNNVRRDLGLILMAEHGFSALVERGGERILFDTGKGAALPHNARALGADLKGLDCVILSHGHYDHTGGLLYVAQCNPRLEVIAHPTALESHMVKGVDQRKAKEIGIPFRMDDIQANGARFTLVREFQEIREGVWFTGEVPRRLAVGSDSRLCVCQGGELVPDPMEDDASVVILSPHGPILLLGCAHSGVVNILELVKQKMAIDRIHAVIGGTHLGFSSNDQTAAFIEAVEACRVQCIATAHCTGPGPTAMLRAHFGRRFSEACAGAVFEF